MPGQQYCNDIYERHQKILRLIPWYVNGSLDDDEQRSVHQHLQVCLECRAELKLQRIIAGRVREVDVEWQQIEKNFASLQAQICNPNSSARAHPVTGNPCQKDGGVRRPMRLAAACLAMLAVGTGGLHLLLQPDARPPTVVQADYRTLGASRQSEQSASGQILVVFEREVDTATIDAILERWRLEVVIYNKDRRLLRLRRADSASDEQRRLQSIVAQLQSTRGVLFAELAIDGN